MTGKKHRITVGFISLGCPKNAVDSERMLAEIAEAGFVISSESYNADVIIVNTCAFIAPAKAESLNAIKQAVADKADPKQKVSRVIVAGCLPERLGLDIYSEIDGIDAVIGLSQRDNVAKIIREVLSSERPIAAFDKSGDPDRNRIPDDRTRLLIAGM